MDPVGTVTSLVEFAITLKETFDQVGENKTKLQGLSTNILNSLQRIERIMATHQEEMALAPDLQEPLGQLEIELQTTLSKCQRRYKRRDGLAKYKGLFVDWKDRETTQKELVRLEQNVNTFYLHFLVDMTTMTTFNTARMDVTMRAMQESLGRISMRLHTDLIPAAEQDMILAEELVGTGHLDQPDIAKAMEEANRALSQAPESSIEQQYIRLQIKTLKGKLDLTAPMEDKSKFSFQMPKLGPSRVAPSSFTPAVQYINISEPLPAPQDAVMECIRLLRRLESAKSSSVSLQTIGELRDLSTALRSLGFLTEAHDICLACVEMCRTLASGSSKPQSVAFDLAMSLTNLSSTASDIGNRAEALDSIKEAVKLFRELAVSRPNVYKSYLAMALLRHSKRLITSGKHEEALVKSTEAIAIDSQLVNVKRVFLPDLAKALIYHAYSLLGTGRFQGSLEHINRAVQISRQLVEESKDQYTPLLSKALNFLSVCLYEQCRYEDSVKAAREAVQIRRMLVELRPEEFSYALTNSLNNLSLSLGEMWQYDEALTVSREAIEIARARLAKEPSDPSKWLLAQCLQPFAQHLKGLGNIEQSIGIARETLVLIRSLAADNEALRTDLSQALLNLGKGLTELGDLEPALENLKESVEIRRVLVESYQRVQLPLLAESLDWLGWCLMGMGRRPEALHAAQESVDLFNYALTNSDCPDAFRMGLVMALSLRSRCLRLAGRSKEALQPAREACELLSSFPPHYPPLSVAYVSGTALRAYSSALHDGGQNELATKKIREALEARRKLPAQYGVDKSESLLKYAQALGDTGHLEEAHRVGTEGIAILRPIAESRPGINRTSLAKGLLKVCRIDAKMEEHKSACVGLAREAVDLLRLQPETFGPELAEALHELALAFQRDNRYREALGAAKEALELRLVWDEEGTIRGFGALVNQSKTMVQRLSEEGVIHASPTPRRAHLQLQEEDLARYSPKHHATLP